MEKTSQSMFARAVLSIEHILMQTLMSWFVRILKWNTLDLLLVLNPDFGKIFHYSYFLSFITHYLVFDIIYCTVPHRLCQRNSVTWLCISFNFIIPFLE